MRYLGLKSYIIGNKHFIAWRQNRDREKGELKYQGRSHEVIETKEESSDILDGPTIFMKTNDLFFEATISMKINILS